MAVLEIDGKKVSCDIKRKDVRHVYLRLKPNFQLDIILPRNRDIDLECILEKKRPWIERKVKEMFQVKRLFNDDSILYKGNTLRVKVYPVKKTHKGVRVYKKVILVYEDSEKKKDEILTDFVTNQTLDYVQEKAKEFSTELGVSYNTISTKGMKKWGYCTKKANLFFNWKLICLPEHLVDYIVLHELLHLKHFNHSKQFKKDMARHLIEYKELEAMLKKYLPY